MEKLTPLIRKHFVLATHILLLIVIFLFVLLDFLKNQTSGYAISQMSLLLISVGALATIGIMVKNKLGFFLSLTFQYLFLFVFLMGTIILFIELSFKSVIIFIVSLICTFIVSNSILIFNSNGFKQNFGFKSKAIGLNIASAFIGIILAMAFFLYVQTK